MICSGPLTNNSSSLTGKQQVKVFALKKIVMPVTIDSEDMKTLGACLNKVVKDGYIENFKVTEKGLKSLETEKLYQPDQIHIVNFFRFEGASDPSDSAILYVIETNDGTKGSLTDAYGMYADPNIDKFIKEVEKYQKKHGRSLIPAIGNNHIFPEIIFLLPDFSFGKFSFPSLVI